MALPTVTLHSVETYDAEEGVCAYNLYFSLDPEEYEGYNFSVFRGGQYVESGDAELGGAGYNKIDSSSACGPQVSVRVVLYTGSGSSRRESFSNAIIFTPNM